MTALNLRPYRRGDVPDESSVPVAVIVLTKDESANIERCLSSLRWAEQVVVVDSGSTDDTVQQAAALGAEVVVEPWRGYGAQREFALRLPMLRHDWAYFVDADEWVSPELAGEVARVLAAPRYDAFAQRRRLVFQSKWIRHCGWYHGTWLVRLMKRSEARFGDDTFGEHAQVAGSVGHLRHDLVDEDRKGLAAWLHKHVRYAELEAAQPGGQLRFRQRWERFCSARDSDSRPLPRAIAKDLVFPLLPARPLATFLYMYAFRRGFLDGTVGLRFCYYHAWFQLTIEALRSEIPTGDHSPAVDSSTAGGRGRDHGCTTSVRSRNW
ncbi:MAG: glycosyltransferase family 2 protein [Streptomycetales bacterium]